MIAPVSANTYRLMESIAVIQQEEIRELKRQIVILEEKNRTLLERLAVVSAGTGNLVVMEKR